jgi:hypothetical protein
MAERLATLVATQVVQVQFPVPDRPKFRVEKVALFCNPASGGTFSITAIEIIKWVRMFAVVSSLRRLGARLDCRCRPLPGPKSDSEVKTDESKGFPTSSGLGPRRTWNTAWKSLRKFVTPELFQRINVLKKRRERER